MSFASPKAKAANKPKEMTIKSQEVSPRLRILGGNHMLFDGFVNTFSMDFNESPQPANNNGNLWNKVLQFVQGKNEDSNVFAKYVQMK